ncbi:MAG: class I SAM-dependent methyltransferase [Rhodospirillales bacterium]|nr:class I SAM-dependent methyltransferase [Rhodospirillales bacterium]
MSVLGNDRDSKEYWKEQAGVYGRALTNDYHSHRLRTIQAIIPNELYGVAKKILDFGCGDAVIFEKFLDFKAEIFGIDASEEMIDLGRKRLRSQGYDENLIRLGTVNDLELLESGSLDAIFSFNVIAYLTFQEEEIFYREVKRIIKPGGWLAVTHSNELFDMFSLNRYTVDFFEKYFVGLGGGGPLKIAKLLTSADRPTQRVMYNIRENPLSYRFKLQKWGFEECRQEFINLHPMPPSLIEGERSYLDTLKVRDEDRWKLIFTCSTFGSLSRRC